MSPPGSSPSADVATAPRRENVRLRARRNIRPKSNLARDGGEHPRQGRVARVQRRSYQHRDGVVRGGDDGRVRVRGATRRAGGDNEDSAPQRERHPRRRAPIASALGRAGGEGVERGRACENRTDGGDGGGARGDPLLDSETPSPATIFSTRARSRQKDARGERRPRGGEEAIVHLRGEGTRAGDGDGRDGGR